MKKQINIEEMLLTSLDVWEIQIKSAIFFMIHTHFMAFLGRLLRSVGRDYHFSGPVRPPQPCLVPRGVVLPTPASAELPSPLHSQPHQISFVLFHTRTRPAVLSLPQHSDVLFDACCYKWQDFILLYGWAVRDRCNELNVTVLMPGVQTWNILGNSVQYQKNKEA